MNMTSKLAIATAFAVLGMSSAQAADLSIGDRIERGWYISGGVSPTVMGLYPDDGTADDVISNTFYGLSGSVELCKAGVGSADWLDLCGGATGFLSLGDASEAANVSGVNITSKSSMTSFGGYVKARAHAGRFVIAPYAGVRHINLDVDLSTTGAALTGSTDLTAAFGGAELGINLFDDRATLAIQAEAGRSISGEDATYASVGPVLRLNF